MPLYSSYTDPIMLQPNFNACVVNNCTQIKFTETTGTYTLSNTGGYGTPNIALGSITTAILTIVDNGGTSHTIDLFDTTYFPSSNKDFSYVIPIASLGLTTIPDGKWLFTYQVSDGSTTYSKAKYELFYCNSECCVKQLLTNLKLDNCGCDCESVDYNEYIKAKSLLDGLKDAARCGDETSFDRIKTTLDRICLNSNCRTCK